MQTQCTTSASANRPSESRNMVGKQKTPVKSFTPVSEVDTTPNIAKRNAPRKLIPDGSSSSLREEGMEEVHQPAHPRYRQQPGIDVLYRNVNHFFQP